MTKVSAVTCIKELKNLAKREDELTPNQLRTELYAWGSLFYRALHHRPAPADPMFPGIHHKDKE